MLKEIYVADHFNQSIRKYTNCLTVAGNNGVPGSTDGQFAIASFNFPNGVVDSSGNIMADRQITKYEKLHLQVKFRQIYQQV
jgi:hypothetical protein